MEVDDEEAEDEDAVREASLKALIEAETAKVAAAAAAAAHTDQLAQGGATVAANERDLWIAMERVRIAGRDTIPNKPENEVHVLAPSL